jgi:hypothetical protein
MFSHLKGLISLWDPGGSGGKRRQPFQNSEPDKTNPSYEQSRSYQILAAHRHCDCRPVRPYGQAGLLPTSRRHRHASAQWQRAQRTACRRCRRTLCMFLGSDGRGNQKHRVARADRTRRLFHVFLRWCNGMHRDRGYFLIIGGRCRCADDDCPFPPPSLRCVAPQFKHTGAVLSP